MKEGQLRDPETGVMSPEFFDDSKGLDNVRLDFNEAFVTMKEFEEYWKLDKILTMPEVSDQYNDVHCALFDVYMRHRRDEALKDIEKGLKKMPSKEILHMITKINSYSTASTEPKMDRKTCIMIADALRMKGYDLISREDAIARENEEAVQEEGAREADFKEDATNAYENKQEKEQRSLLTNEKKQKNYERKRRHRHRGRGYRNSPNHSTPKIARGLNQADGMQQNQLLAQAALVNHDLSIHGNFYNQHLYNLVRLSPPMPLPAPMQPPYQLSPLLAMGGPAPVPLLGPDFVQPRGNSVRRPAVNANNHQRVVVPPPLPLPQAPAQQVNQLHLPPPPPLSRSMYPSISDRLRAIFTNYPTPSPHLSVT